MPAIPRFRVVSGGRAFSRPVSATGMATPRSSTHRSGSRAAARRACGPCGHLGMGSGQRELELHRSTDRPPARTGSSAWPPRIRRGDPGRPVTIGIHMEDLEEDRRSGRPRPPAGATSSRCTAIRSTLTGRREHRRRVLPFLAEVTRWLAGGAPILFEEFGLPTGTSWRRRPPAGRRSGRSPLHRPLSRRPPRRRLHRGVPVVLRGLCQ